MKTRLFSIMAALLLSGASAFAQSENTTPLKGDVNGDGTVDVADIVAVIDIMQNGGGTETSYTYYLGETEDETFTTASFNQTGTKPTSITANKSTGDTVTVWIYPESWGKPTKIVHDASKSDYTKAWTYNDTWLNVPAGYIGAWFQASANSTFTVTW